MDLLALLNVDELPEQQTRMMALIDRHPELDVRLGFDACCTCAKSLADDDDGGVGVSSSSSVALKVTCFQCRRVDYCSEACREQDARACRLVPSSSATADNDNDDNDDGAADTAAGHSPIICALLKTCQDDEDVEHNEAGHLDAERREAAQDRIRSELESYPATLANVIAEGPCYRTALRNAATSNNKRLVLHVVGATDEAELWGKCNNDLDTVMEAYAEALSSLAEEAKVSLIELYMVGPDCPTTDVEQTRSMMKTTTTNSSCSASAAELMLRTHRGVYNSAMLRDHNIPKADVVLFFNPGFTVPEYKNWVDTLHCIPRGTPFLSTTNTEMEGIADCQFLLDQDLFQTIPPGLADLLGLYSSPDNNHNEDDEEEDDDDMAQCRETSFFTINPFCGTRVRQSGTMGNDLFVKNRWMLGGILDSFDPNLSQQHDKPGGSKKKKQKRTTGGNTNTKVSNPALI